METLLEQMLPFLDVSTDISIFWFVMKIFFIIAFFLYFLFALIVMRQVFMMTTTFKTDAELVLKIFSFLHLFFAIAVLIASFVIL